MVQVVGTGSMHANEKVDFGQMRKSMRNEESMRVRARGQGGAWCHTHPTGELHHKCAFQLDGTTYDAHGHTDGQTMFGGAYVERSLWNERGMRSCGGVGGGGEDDGGEGGSVRRKTVLLKPIRPRERPGDIWQIRSLIA